MVKLCYNEPLCAVDKGNVSLEGVIFHFPERQTSWVKVTTQCLVVCNDYKSPCPLRLDWIDLMPDKSPLNDLNCWTCLVCAGVSLHNNICGELLEIEKNRIGKRTSRSYSMRLQKIH